VKQDYEQDRLVGRTTSEEGHQKHMKSQDLECMHEVIIIMSVGKWVFCEIINIYDLSGGCISYLFIPMCIAHPICLCVVMIG